MPKKNMHQVHKKIILPLPNNAAFSEVYSRLSPSIMADKPHGNRMLKIIHLQEMLTAFFIFIFDLYINKLGKNTQVGWG